MNAYILDNYNYYCKLVVPVYTYNIIDSIYDAVTTVAVPAEKAGSIEAGDIIKIPSVWAGLVNQVSTDNGIATLNCKQIINILGRQQFYTGDFEMPIENYVAKHISTQYTNCADEYYRRSYISTYVASATSQNLPPTEAAGQIYTLKSYINNLGRIAAIKCTVDAQIDTLQFSLTKYQRGAKNVDMGNPSYILQESAVSAQAITKITAYAQDTQRYSNWYLDINGDILRTKPLIAQRPAGEWGALVVSKEADVEQKVMEKIRANAYSHKITFDAYPEDDFKLYDQLNIKVKGKVYPSYVTSITTSSQSALKRIECGELQTRYPYLELI